MAALTAQDVSEALAPLMPGFVADGMLLNVAEIDSNTIRIVYSKTDDACEECIMPLESLEHLFTECLRKAGIQSHVVRVEEVGAS